MRILTAALLLTLAANASAQLPNEDYRGITATGLALRKLSTAQRVLVIGAHPDDEDNQLLTYLSLHDGVDLAYLSLTRGEGGQNSIGPELGPALGVLRTGELLAARELDRGMQFFTRAYDFGFSKTAEETLQHWPKDSVLSDVVSIVRRYRPDVIIAIFTGTPTDGHGQHQLSGMLAREAFVAAADPARFPEQIRNGLPAHRAARLFQATGYRQGQPTQLFPTGTLDPLFGRSYAQIAAESRSRHRSQDMGQVQPLGPRATSIRLLESRVPVTDSTLLSGIPATLSARAATARQPTNVQRSLVRYDSLIASARSQLGAFSSARVADLLAGAIGELDAALPLITDTALLINAQGERVEANDALVLASGLVVDALVSSDVIVPGSTIDVDITAWNGGDVPVRIEQLEPVLPAGWTAARSDSTGNSLAPGALVTRRYRVSVPHDAAVSQPYFLALPRPGDYYAWPSDQNHAGFAFQLPEVRAAAVLNVRNTSVRTFVNATRRIVDPRQGELRRAPHVVPAFTLRADPATTVVTLAALASGSRKGVDVNVEVGSNGAGGTVTVTPILPAGWRAVPAQATVTLRARESAGVHFSVEPARSATAGKYSIALTATDSAGRSYALTQRNVDHPHIVNRVLFEPAVVNVTVLDAKFARALRIGYVVGMDAAVPPVLEQLGIIVEKLDESALAGGELGKYDAIVVGSRAYEVRPDLAAHNARLLDYARSGGNLIVQYQQYEFIQGGFAPFQLTLARPHDRITDENSPVRLLDPAARALARPNRISDRDFQDWVQERALYMPNTWAPPYKPLLEMTDPGEAPRQGAVLVAPIGSGLYTYTGIAFFREIPAGVPGALRLFINLLSQGVRDVNF